MCYFTSRSVAALSLLFCLFAQTGARASDVPTTSSAVLDLSGTWEFRLDPEDVGTTQGWFDAGASFDKSIQVPGAWNALGVEFESDAQLRAYERLKDEEDRRSASVLPEPGESNRLFHVYPGPAWYRKTVDIPADWTDKNITLTFEGVHRSADVWLNGKPAASHVSYITPLRLNVNDYARPGERLTIVARVDGRRDRLKDPLMGCMDTVDFVYAAWGGIFRPVLLEAKSRASIEDVFAVPSLADSTVELRTILLADDDALLAARIVDQAGQTVARQSHAIASNTSQSTIRLSLPDAQTWSPQNPHLYTAHLELSAGGKILDTHTVRFGMREFQVKNKQFLLNGRPIFLRGYGDDCIFPHTISPPLDKDEYRRRLTAARDYGFNYVRHHSWVPLREYLDVADELGMMVQPEFPFAYSRDLPTTTETRASAVEQWKEVIRLNRNHPSIIAWSMGNELYDSFPMAPEMYRLAKELDPTRPVIESDGTYIQNSKRPTLDYLAVTFDEANSIGHGDGKYNFPPDTPKPVISHEMGYFVTLHDLTQLPLFRNGLRPYWLTRANELAERNGVTHLYPDWLAASYRLQAVCLKTNLEAVRRSALSGTSVWLFQDYPNCAEGVVDMFFRKKALSAEEFRKFNAPTVLLLDESKRSFRSGESVTLPVSVSRFEDPPSTSATLQWKLLTQSGQTLLHGTSDTLSVAEGVHPLTKISLTLPQAADRGLSLTFAVQLSDASGSWDNSWNLWVFPPAQQFFPDVLMLSEGLAEHSGTATRTLNIHEPNHLPKLVVTDQLSTDVLHYLTRGGSVFLLNPELAFTCEGTNFRLSSWDGGGPSGTTFNPAHPALSRFPSEGWCDLQFYHLVQQSKSIMLDPLAEKIEPIIRCIDRPTRLANRAYLFEAGVGEGKLLVSGLNFKGALAAGDTAAQSLLDHLVTYCTSRAFTPKTSLPAELFRK